MNRADLRNKLANLYPTAAGARRVAGDAELHLERIHFEGSAIEVWDDLLREAERNPGKVERVVAIARAEYPGGWDDAPAVTPRAPRAWSRLALAGVAAVAGAAFVLAALKGQPSRTTAAPGVGPGRGPDAGPPDVPQVVSPMVAAASGCEGLAIDDVLVARGDGGVSLDVRVRSMGAHTINITRAVIRRDHSRVEPAHPTPAAVEATEVYRTRRREAGAARWDGVPIAVAHALRPEEVDRFVIHVEGLGNGEASHVTAVLELKFNGECRAVSAPFELPP